jgi:hypothetical protein
MPAQMKGTPVSSVRKAKTPLSPPCIPPKFVLHGLSSKSKFIGVNIFIKNLRIWTQRSNHINRLVPELS